MADTIFQGTDGDWGNDGSWSGVEPAESDRAFMPGTNATSVTAGLDNGGVDLALLQTDPNYVGHIGASGTPLIIAANKVEHYGSGQLFYKSAIVADPSPGLDITDWFLVDSINRENAATLDGEQITRVTVISGKVTLLGTLGDTGTHGGNAVLTEFVETSFHDNPASDAEVIINCALKASTGTVRMNGGKVTSIGAIAKVLMSGGKWIHDTAAVALLEMYGGTAWWKPTATLLEAHIFGGVLDLTQTTLPKTVTDLNLYPGGTLIYNPTLFTGTLNNMGGNLIVTTRGVGGRVGGPFPPPGP